MHESGLALSLPSGVNSNEYFRQTISLKLLGGVFPFQLGPNENCEADYCKVIL